MATNHGDAPAWVGVAGTLVRRRRTLAVATTLGTVASVVVALLLPPTFTSRVAFLPPQQGQSAAASALSSLGALGSLAGAAAGIRSPGEQYVALLQSVTVADRLIDQFGLMAVYDVEYRFKARKELAKNVRISLGKKDGLISLEVDDESAKRAADIANQYVLELKRLTEQLALTEAQQRRMFFEAQMGQAKRKLVDAQAALQSSGFSVDALKAEPKATAETFAKMKAELTAAEVRLQALRQNLSEVAPEVRLALSAVNTLRAQVAKVESPLDSGPDATYVSRYREFKYQETLFELFSRQYELARVDESRDGPLLQVIDPAQPAERRSKPKRALLVLGGLLLSLVASSALILARANYRRRVSNGEDPWGLRALRASAAAPNE